MFGFALNFGQKLLDRQTAQDDLLVRDGGQIDAGKPGHFNIVNTINIKPPTVTVAMV